MHGREHDALILRPDHGDIFAGDRIRERDFFQKRVYVFVAQRVLRQLLEIVQPRLRVGEFRSGIVGVSALHDQMDALGWVPLHRLGGERAQDGAEGVETLSHSTPRRAEARRSTEKRVQRIAVLRNAAPHISRRFLADLRIQFQHPLPR